jgi:ABC-type lipoprotein export system ATPase subunit
MRSVSRSFPSGREVLSDLDLDVEAGELVAVVGRSGVGKTTLLNIIGGLDTSYHGSVEVDGRRLADLGDRELSSFRGRTVGFVFQAYNLLEHLTVAENASLPWLFAHGHGSIGDRHEARRRAHEVLEEVGLADRADDVPPALSGGERQRVALARALFHRPRLLLCDEPTGNLDEATAVRIADLLQGVHRGGAVTVVIATHDPAMSRLADRVLVLSGGALASRSHDGGVGE